MKNEIIPYLFDETLVRVVMHNGDPRFVISDVCKAIEHSNPSMVIQRLHKDDLSTAYVIDNMGREQSVNVCNESGLYLLIFQSRKPAARTFTRWVTSEVLPTIRKTGSYDNERHYTLAERNFLNLVKDLISLGIQPSDAQQTALALSLNVGKPTFPKRAQKTEERWTGYKEEYKVYAERYDTSERTIKRWVAIGKRSGHPCPLDDPQSLSAWWEKTRGQQVPNRFEAN